MATSIVGEKSYRFATRIVKLSKQLLRSGTSIGVNIAQALQGQSRADFIAKLSIALKETSETKYWLRLLHTTEYINNLEFRCVIAECIKIEKLLTFIIHTSKSSFQLFTRMQGGERYVPGFIQKIPSPNL